MNAFVTHKLLPAALAVALIAGGALAWRRHQASVVPAGLVSGNGRIEATEVDVATKLPGRLRDLTVQEGELVRAGQVLGHMQLEALEAQRDEAQARVQQAVTAVAAAQAQVAVRESDLLALQAVVAQRRSELDAAQRRLARSQALVHEGASSDQEVDDDRARERSLQAAVVAAQAQAGAAQAGIVAARTQVAGAQASLVAAQATVARVQADIRDSALTAPTGGRVQYRVAQPGEVLGAGGKVLNLVDLEDVSMSFFVPETVAGRLALGTEVRLQVDAAPGVVIPARVSFVASTAQFTPKTVETANERQKLMFRVKARIAPALLRQHLAQVKTGVPGVAWIRLDPQAPWPAALAQPLPVPAQP